MSLQDWGAIGEIVGAIAVVITLIYLALQVRDSNKATRVATVQSALDSEIQVVSTLAAYAGTWDKVIRGAQLDAGEEKRRGIMLFNMLMIMVEKQYHQAQTGLLDRKAWEGRLGSLRMVVILPIYESWRTTAGAHAKSPTFLSLLDELRATAQPGE